jgi:VIT1/CCC1 family predicted Fe2+/Mn2+ transporter
MDHSIKTGLYFGLTSGIITTMGLMVGLHSGTHSDLVVLGGILTIAVADAFSDALGIHMSEESEDKHTAKEVWQATLTTFLSKFLFAMTFIIPILLFELNTAIIISAAWGLLALGILSYVIAKAEKKKSLIVIGEHLLIAVIVIIITHYLGDLVRRMFV